MTFNLGQITPLKFDWDEHNQEKNWQKHHVHVKEIEEIFFNEPTKFFPDPHHSKTETRLTAYGRTNANRKLTVVFTLRNNKIRVISARNQSQKERQVYDQK